MHHASAIPLHDKAARMAKPMDRDLTACPPPVLGDILALLRAPGEVCLDEITIALQALHVDCEALGAAVFADAAAYVRTLLYRDARVEMLALTWLPQQRSPVHNHGASTCIVRVVSGVAHENLYRARDDGAERREYLDRLLHPGLVVRTPGEHYHSLGNAAHAGGETLVTLHVYSPPLAPR